VSFQDWTENSPEFTSSYDVSSPTGWQSFYSRYVGPTGNFPLRRIIEIAQQHGVKSVLVETRYIDADWRSEHASFYSTTFTRYPSVAHRAHFFTEPLPADLGDVSQLRDAYKGYTVLRPLKSSPVGRTMIEPPPELGTATRCEAIEQVDVLGWQMSVRGMPFISQDAQYLRCAHADMWMVLRHAFLRRQLSRKLPSDIHDAAMGGVVNDRQVPSEGLSHHQMMAAMSVLGLSPATLSLPKTAADNANAGDLGLFQILCRYVNSNITPMVYSGNHIWIIVAYARVASAGHGNLTLYRHDDAMGPYIRVDDPWNEPSPDHTPWAQVIMPLPPKIYMTAERAEAIGRWWFEEWITTADPANPLSQAHQQGDFTVRIYGIDSSEYKFALDSRTGFDSDVARQYRLAPWPRNLWVIEAVDRKLRGTASGSVLGEVIIDPTANHYPSRLDPGILAAHAPGYWMRRTPDEDSQQSGACGDGFYETGRPDFAASVP
jgi:hypothetical protein